MCIIGKKSNRSIEYCDDKNITFYEECSIICCTNSNIVKYFQKHKYFSRLLVSTFNKCQNNHPVYSVADVRVLAT